jgi:hypothetical protein
MDNSSTTTATLDQADEDILTYEISDEALEATAEPVAGVLRHSLTLVIPGVIPYGCC